jgi:hypothetical protein
MTGAYLLSYDHLRRLSVLGWGKLRPEVPEMFTWTFLEVLEKLQALSSTK